MQQQELFPTFTFDDRFDRLYKKMKTEWEMRDVDPLKNIDTIKKYGKIFKVDCETVVTAWEKYTGYEYRCE